MTVDEICDSAKARHGVEVPLEVRGFVVRALAMKIDFDIMPNASGKKPTGSDQAAAVRPLLGHNGIPLQYESKSGLYATSIDGKKCYLIAVCRGDDTIDEIVLRKNLADLNGGTLLGKVNTDTEFGSNLHGLINPIYETLTDKDGVTSPVIHMWDERLMVMDPKFPVYTNASHPQWSSCYFPLNQPSVLRNHNCVSPFSDTEHPGRGFERQCVAVIGGAYPQTTELAAQLIRQHADERLQYFIVGSGGRREGMAILHSPEITTETDPAFMLSMLGPGMMPRVQALLLDAVTRHCKTGASVIAVPDSILSAFSALVREVCGHYGASYISIIDALQEYLEENRPQRLSVMTTFERAGPGRIIYENICTNESARYAENIIPLNDKEIGKNEGLCLTIRKPNQTLRHLLDRFVSNIRTHAARVANETSSNEELTVVLGHTGLSFLHQELRRLAEGRGFAIDPRNGCAIAKGGFLVRTSTEEQAQDRAPTIDTHISVKIIDPMEIYAEAVARQAIPWFMPSPRKPAPDRVLNPKRMPT